MAEHKLSFTAEQIDEKLSRVLPMVEITTEPTPEGARMTEQEAADIEAAASTGLPIIIKYTTFGMSLVAVNAGTQVTFALNGGSISFEQIDQEGDIFWAAFLYYPQN